MRLQASDGTFCSLVREAVANTLSELKSDAAVSDYDTLKAVSGGVLDCWRAAERAVAAAVEDQQEKFISNHTRLTNLVALVMPLFESCDTEFAKAATTLRCRPEYGGLSYQSAHHALLTEVVTVVQITGLLSIDSDVREAPGDLVITTSEADIRKQWNVIQRAFCQSPTFDASNVELQCGLELAEVLPEFVGNDFQLQIMKALDGRALSKQSLADEVCGGEGSRLYRKGGIKELVESGFIANKPRLGYYRPNAPPLKNAMN